VLRSLGLSSAAANSSLIYLLSLNCFLVKPERGHRTTSPALPPGWSLCPPSINCPLEPAVALGGRLATTRTALASTFQGYRRPDGHPHAFRTGFGSLAVCPTVIPGSNPPLPSFDRPTDWKSKVPPTPTPLRHISASSGEFRQQPRHGYRRHWRNRPSHLRYGLFRFCDERSGGP
jgi:hypothetical protein